MKILILGKSLFFPSKEERRKKSEGRGGEGRGGAGYQGRMLIKKFVSKKAGEEKIFFNKKMRFTKKISGVVPFAAGNFIFDFASTRKGR